ncbi:hypothetical protein [Mycolicibacterium sp.]
MTQQEARPIKRYSDEWWANYAHAENRCVAHQRAEKGGNQCHLPARRGGTVCRFHGGAAPQVKAKARERLDLAADRMARELLGIATGAESEAVKLAAVKDALDRSGVTGKQAVEVEVKAPWEELLGDVMQITKAQHDAMMRGEYQPATPEPPGPPALPPAPEDRDDVVDAEIVEDPPERTGDHADRPRVPEWAEPAPAAPTRQLVPLEQAASDVAAANRPTRVSQTRRKRR